MMQETLELKARRYAPVIYTQNGNKVFTPAESYALGDILITPPKILYQQLKSWQEFRRYPPEDLKRLLFDVADSYSVQMVEKTPTGRYRRGKKNLLSLSPAELRFALLRKLFAEKESYNLWNVGGDKAVRREKRNSQRPYTGKIIMTGQIKAMERGGRNNVPPYYSVNVTGPFDLPKGFYDTCQDFRWTEAKEGPVNISGACAHCAALQIYGEQNPALIRNFLNISKFDKKEFLLPFNFRQSQSHDMHGLSTEEMDYLSAKDLDLSHLKIDVLVDHLFNKSTYFEIGKKLLRIPNIYHPVLLGAVFNGKVFYEVIIQEHVKKDVDSEQLKDTKKMLGEMLKQMEIKGYKAQGYVLEFRDSQWETVCINYEKGNKMVRILFNHRFPPVFVYRTKNPNSIVEPFLIEPYTHPFMHLFELESRIDDRTKQITSFEVRVPTQFTKVRIPDSLRKNYKKEIGEKHPGGLDGLATKLRERKEPGGEEFIAWVAS